MKTPIVDFVEAYCRRDPLRLHVPGHKGQGAVEAMDITEVAGADVLYHGQGIIAQSQDNARRLFGTQKTVYSTEGSSLAIRAMVQLSKMYAIATGKNCRIVAARNAHKTFVTAAALLDMPVTWIYPTKQEDLISCRIDPAQLEQLLAQEKPAAVYITSPDYLGNVADIPALSRVCHSHGALLLVDNAHGAYLRFLQPSRHPMDLGADMCCDSAHKTLPVLTGGAYLHISVNAPAMLAQQAETAMSLFASTSPSYLILQSLDRANVWLESGCRQALEDYARAVAAMKQRLAEYVFMGDEPLKLTICAKTHGYTGNQLAQLLGEKGIECEFSDPDYVVLMLTPFNGMDALQKLEQALTEIPGAEPIMRQMPTMPIPEQVMSAHEAIFRPGQTLPVSQCLGKVLAAPTVCCPPAIAVLVCGEKVTEEAAQVFAYYGIEELTVI